jgi:hypothetical protein
VRLRITIEEIETGETEDVLAGLVVAKRWEVEHGESISKKLEENTPTAVVELAHLAYNRKHGKSLTIDEFEDRFEPIELDSSGTKAPNPSDPATAPS